MNLKERIRGACHAYMPCVHACSGACVLTRGLLLHGQAPEAGPEAQLFEGVRGIMQASAQSLRLTRLSGRRDMSTLLAQSAFSVRCSFLPPLSPIPGTSNTAA